MSQKKAKAARRVERLKVWKIDLKKYAVEVQGKDEKGNIKPMKTSFDVKESLASILFIADLRLGIDEAFKAKELADKIRKAGEHVLLDNAEMDRLRASYNVSKGPAEHELEFFRRIRDAVEVEAAEVVEEEEPSK